jgi:hypothetical protein
MLRNRYHRYSNEGLEDYIWTNNNNTEKKIEVINLCNQFDNETEKNNFVNDDNKK